MFMRMCRRGLIPLTAVVLLFFEQAAAQNSLPRDTPLVSFKSRPTLFLNLDRNSSFVSGKSAVTNEIRGGIEFKKKLKFGIGWANLASDVVVKDSILTSDTQVDSAISKELSLSYWTLSAEYTVYDSKRWQVTVPAFVGLGSSYFYHYEMIDNVWKKRRTDEGNVLLTGISGVATFRIFRWIGVSGGLGFRFLLVDNSKITESFNSPVYLLRIRIFVGEIYKTIFPRGVSGKRNPPYSNEYWD